jgi:HAE1 family hydrophobic/amphiphilic exporter-1
MGRIGRGIDYVRDGYAALVRRILRLSILSILVVAAFAFAAFGVLRLTPTGFLPEEDQGGFFINVQLPDGASVNRTSEAVRQVEDLLKTMPQVQDTISIIGFSLLDQYSASNNAFMVARLRPFADRTKAGDSAQALIARVLGDSQNIRTATVLPFNLPPVIGLSTTGGFE